MMKNIGNYKIIIILFLTFILSGCSAEYSVEIQKNNRVVEEIIILDDNANIMKTNPDVKDFIKSYLSYELTNEELKQYKLEEIYEDTKSGVKFTRTFSTIDDYLENSPFKQKGFRNMKKNIDGDVITLESKYFSGFSYFYEDVNGESSLNNLNITIKTPFIVNEHNADDDESSTKKENVLKWDLSSKPYDTPFKLVLNTNKMVGESAFSFIGTEYLVLGFYGIIVIAIIIVVYLLSMKNNKI